MPRMKKKNYSTSTVYGGQTLRHHFNIIPNNCMKYTRHQMRYTFSLIYIVHTHFVCYWVKCVYSFPLARALNLYACPVRRASFSHTLCVCMSVFELQCIRAIYLLCNVIESTILMEVTSFPLWPWRRMMNNFFLVTLNLYLLNIA